MNEDERVRVGWGRIGMVEIFETMQCGLWEWEWKRHLAGWRVHVTKPGKACNATTLPNPHSLMQRWLFTKHPCPRHAPHATA